MFRISSIIGYVKDFFLKGQGRSVEAKKHIVLSLIIRGISIAISLLLVPLTINYVNPTQYGIWLTLSSIIAWVSFFDIGFGHGLRNRFAEALAVRDIELARKYVSTTYAILILIFSIVFILFTVANFFIDWSIILNAPPVMASELSILSLIVIGFFCLQMILRVIRTILLADQKPALASGIEMSGQFLALIFIFFLSKTSGGSLIKLGLAVGFAQIIILLISSLLFFIGRYRRYAPTFKAIDFLKAKDILSLGVKFFVIQISAVVIFQTTNIVITQVLGPTQVTTYNIAYKYFFSIGMIFIIILTPFWSAFTDAYAKNDFVWMREALLRLKRVWLMIIPVVLLMLLLSSYVYKLWIGDSVIISFSISVFSAIYVILFSRFNLFIYLINGIGKIKVQLYTNVLISIVYIPMAIYLGKWFDLEGVIFANIVVALAHSIIGKIQVHKLVYKTAEGVWNK